MAVYYKINYFIGYGYLIHNLVLFFYNNNNFTKVFLCIHSFLIAACQWVLRGKYQSQTKKWALVIVTIMYMVYGIANYHFFFKLSFEGYVGKVATLDTLYLFWLDGINYDIYYWGLLLCTPHWYFKAIIFLIVVEYYFVQMYGLNVFSS